MQNYFNYFTEIEEHFQRRRGSLLLLSTLDWALIETWREAQIPLEIVLRGIDEAFDKYQARQRRGPQRRVNGLAWCAQAVMEAAERHREAALGMAPPTTGSESSAQSGFETERIAAHLQTAAAALVQPAFAPEAIGPTLRSLATRVASLADAVLAGTEQDLEALERQLTVLEDKLFATLAANAPEELLLTLKTEAARELAAYRSRISGVQMRQIEQQFLHKRLLEHYQLPRLSLFYMQQAP